MPSTAEQARLAKIYEDLRERLLDMSLRNPMLSYKHRATSKRQLQIIDEVPEAVYRSLTVGGGSAEVIPLPEPDEVPRDERSADFLAALDHARAWDANHLAKIQVLEHSGAADEFALAKAERELRDRVRVDLGLPPRPNRRTINPVEHARELGIEPSVELRAAPAQDGHDARTLQTLKWPDTLQATLERLSDDARLAEQETGLSTLFLVFGFLEWTEHEDSGKVLHAPLLLLPVKLDKRRVAHGRIAYSLSATAGEADGNLSLQKKLEREFRRLLPAFAAHEEAAHPVEDYFARVSQAIEGERGWKVRRWLTLGHFAFGRFAIYADLAASNWPTHPVTHALVGSVVQGSEADGDDGSSLLTPPDDYPVDDPEVERAAPILIHDADASQHSAVVDAMRGRHLVIQGPPGTGKSQTITNIIANALAQHKTVLFLSEKQAALDVVKRRLDIAGLGEFCMELHSEKATPKLAVESLRVRYALGAESSGRRAASLPDGIWEESRREVSAYIAALHAPETDGMAPFDLIWRALRTRSELGEHLDHFQKVVLPLEVHEDPSAYQRTFGAVSVYARMAADFAASYGRHDASPWHALTFSTGANSSIAYGLLLDLGHLRQSADTALEVIAEAGDVGIDDLACLELLADLHHDLPRAGPDGALVELLADVDGAQVEQLILLKSDLERLDQASAPAFREVSDLDAMRAQAATLIELATGTEAIGLTPSQVVAYAARQSEAAVALAQALEELRPALSILGLRRVFPCKGAYGVIYAALTASKLSGDMRPWFAWRPDGGTASFEAVRQEWSEVVAEDTNWRGRFPSYREPLWPPADELRLAASIAGKGALARFLGGMTGEKKLLAGTLQQLGLPAGSRLAPGDLERLARHSQGLATFLGNRSHQSLLGEAWKGLDTPFNVIARTLALRTEAELQIGSLPGGSLIVNRLNALDAEGLAALGRTYERIRSILDSPPTLQRLLDARAVDLVLADLVRIHDASGAVLHLDLGCDVFRLELPVSDLDNCLRTEASRREARTRLAAHPLASEAPALVASAATVSATREALAWIAAVRDRPMPEPLRVALLSRQAAASRDRLAELGRRAAAVLAGLQECAALMEARHGVAGFDIRDPQALARTLDDLLRHKDELTDYLTLRSQREQLATLGLTPLLAKAEEVSLHAGGLLPLFSGLVSQRRAARARRTDPVLARAAGLRIEARRKEFIERDRRKLAADRQKVRQALLALTIPIGSRQGPRKSWTGLELLRNEFGKEKRFAPVRELIRRAGSAIQVMKPCFMMSPLSLAKFMPGKALSFDLVVIDEASQMRPEDALGGLLRSKQLVVVGDPKQLPPTDFFSRSGDGAPATDDEEFEDIDAESILEACQKTFRLTRLLRWHYRSRCESLISFSNREFYHNRLITFPMAKPGSFSIELVRVEGTYDARRNAAEAQAVAEEAVAFMRRFADEEPDSMPSLGIVALNGDQRDLIFEEIRRLEAGDELVERYREKVAKRGEPMFVKNLENVQGDERDFVFVSLTYGPKPGSNVVLQRFGPINGKQGHRRLNVLFTRARIRVGLFASLGSADIKPAETSAEGVRVLKRYLEYVERQGHFEVDEAGAAADSDFEAEVAHRLRARGYVVDHQVGASKFRIDLGVRHPDHPERFLAGIECDGARYHSSRSARDRDRLREEVLIGLGWNMLRVWSTDWFDNPDLQTDRMARRLEELRAAPPPPQEGYRLTAVLPRDAMAETTLGRHGGVDAVDGASPEGATENGPASASAAGPDGPPENQNPSVPPTQPSVLDGTGSLTVTEVANALREFRDAVIAVECEPWEAQRSILRESMIETLIAQRVADPEEWFSKVPQFQRIGTNPAEKGKYLERICDLVARLEENAAPPRTRQPGFELRSTTLQPRAKQGTLFSAAGRMRQG